MLVTLLDATVRWQADAERRHGALTDTERRLVYGLTEYLAAVLVTSSVGDCDGVHEAEELLEAGEDMQTYEEASE